MAKKNGFTLLEVLLVLAIWSVLLLLVAPINFPILDEQQEKQFLETLAFDVLYAQSLSTTTKEYVRINVHTDNYIIRKGNENTKLVERLLPIGWKIDVRTLPLISFDDNGRMKTPGSFVINTKHRSYKIIFPFGKGRFHVVEL